MKLSIQTQDLLYKLQPCAEVAEKKDKGTSAFSKHVLLTASTKAIELRAFKQPLSIRATIVDDHAFDVSTPGTIAVQADDLLRRIKALTDDEVALETAGTRLVIRGATSKRRYEMGFIGWEDFPMFPVCPAGGVAVPAAHAFAVLSRTCYAAATDDLFYEYHGVELRGDSGTLMATATNGHRLMRVATPSAATVRLFLPQPAAMLLRYTLGDGADDGDVTMAASTALFFASFDGIELACSRPAVEPPPYDVVLALLDGISGPVVDRAAMLGEVQGLTVDGFSSGAHLEVAADGPVVRLRHCNTAGADNAGSVACEGGGRWRAYVDARYMIEALRRLTSDRLELCMPTEARSGFIGIRSGTSEIATIGLCRPDAIPWAAKEAA